MSNYKYDGTDDILDSRDIQERIEEIESEYPDIESIETLEGWDDLIEKITERYDNREDAEEYIDLIRLREDVQSHANEGWEYGVILVRKDYADGEWAKERAYDFGVFQSQDYGIGHPGRATTEDLARQWPFTHIDWDAAADALHEDAAEFDFRGVTYFEN